MTHPVAENAKQDVDLRRSEVLDAAAILFASRGYHAASMREIATQLNIKAGSLYYHISSKEQLLTEICAIGMQQLHLNADRAIADHSYFSGRIKTIVGGHARLFHDYGNYLRCYQTEYVHLPLKMQEEMLLELRLFHRKIDDIFKDAQSKGEVRTDLEPKTMRFAVVAMMHQISQMQSQKVRSNIVAMAEGFSEILISGFKPR
jgi:AcrR family transcriptional regulator